MKFRTKFVFTSQSCKKTLSTLVNELFVGRSGKTRYQYINNHTTYHKTSSNVRLLICHLHTLLTNVIRK